MLHQLFTYDFGNSQMVQSGDDIIYFSKQPGGVFKTKKLIKLFIYKTSYPARKIYWFLS